MKFFSIIGFLLANVVFIQCGKSGGGSVQQPLTSAPANFNITSLTIDGMSNNAIYYDVSPTPSIKFNFPTKISRTTSNGSIALKDNSGSNVSCNVAYENGDSSIVLVPSAPLGLLSRYLVTVSNQLRSVNGGSLVNAVQTTLQTSIDSSFKFPVISDDALLSLVQQRTFKYFWDFAHPVSGLARERNTSGDLVTSGGSGFGIMAIITGIERNFVTRAQALTRLQTIVGFLSSKAQRFKGAFPHWLNGATGAVIPFSSKDNGADLVETSYLVQGLITARQYFNGSDPAETTLRNDINTICNEVQWNWFQKNNENVLYWHWSPDYNWEMNHKIQGWNECLITYVLAASSANYSIPKTVYDLGWASNGAMRNNNTYYGTSLPLGPSQGGPLFFAHYSFLGINPNSLSDSYANYATQNRSHSLINYSYTSANPKRFYGYSGSVWGLTASDIPNGYTASSPTNDVGVIAPTAALSSLPYTPQESMRALKFFYYVLGDKLWKDYGFIDAFSLHELWFADSFLAIDQGPIIIMIENYRTGLLWNLFTSAPEVKSALKKLGFSATYL